MNAFTTYESRLDADADWALREGSMHFDQESSVQRTLKDVTKRLNELGVPYAVAGGLALFFHGFRRFTEDVDILISKPSLEIIHRNLVGLGYLPPFEGSKNLRDTQTGVRIEFLIAGDYPGDGKPKPISFPDPALASTELSGIRFLTLKSIVELKLASGISNPRRAKDLVDVQALIEQLSLNESFAEQLDPYVRHKFCEIVHLIRDNPP